MRLRVEGNRGRFWGFWGLPDALVRDTAAAVLAASSVARLLVVTDDPEVGAAVRELGAGVVPDPGGGLNAAMRFGADEAAGLSAYRVVLAGDRGDPAARG
mgnify:CR=1 FL=1